MVLATTKAIIHIILLMSSIIFKKITEDHNVYYDPILWYTDMQI